MRKFLSFASWNVRPVKNKYLHACIWSAEQSQCCAQRTLPGIYTNMADRILWEISKHSNLIIDSMTLRDSVYSNKNSRRLHLHMYISIFVLIYSCNTDFSQECLELSLDFEINLFEHVNEQLHICRLNSCIKIYINESDYFITVFMDHS